MNKIQTIRFRKIYLYYIIIFTTFLTSISLTHAQNTPNAQNITNQVTGNQGIFLEEHQIFYIVIGVAIGSLYGFCLIFMLILNSRGGTIKTLLTNPLTEPGNELIKTLNKNNTDLISSLVEGITIVLVVISIIILGLSGLLGSEGIIGILSAIVGYVLGSSRSYDKSQNDREKQPSQLQPQPQPQPQQTVITNPDNGNDNDNNNNND